jgi:hypothetical protein
LLEEFFELPLGSLGLEFETRNVPRGRRNDPHSALAAIPRLVAHGIEKRGEGILLYLLGSRKPFGELTFAIALLEFRPNRTTERSDSVNDNHTYMVTRMGKMSNGILTELVLYSLTLTYSVLGTRIRLMRGGAQSTEQYFNAFSTDN